MDYQKEYLDKNPDMHIGDSTMKVKQINRVIPSSLKIESLLDVACGAGLITIEMTKKIKPKYAAGIDISEAMINKAKIIDQNNLVIWKVVDLFKYKPKRKFDLVTCIDILEHINDDLGFLKKIATLGKYFVIKTPLEDSWFSRLLRNSKIFDPWKDSENRYGHIHHYNERTLLNLINQCGLKIEKAISIPMPKRTKFAWEIFRLLFYPISFVSMEKMVRISGGFKIYLLSNK